MYLTDRCRIKSREILKAFCNDSVLVEYRRSVVMVDTHGCSAVQAPMVRWVTQSCAVYQLLLIISAGIYHVIKHFFLENGNLGYNDCFESYDKRDRLRFCLG